MLVIVGFNWLSVNLGWKDLIGQIDWSVYWPLVPLFLGLMMYSWKGTRGLAIGLVSTILMVTMVLMIVFGIQVY